jgi:peptide/nickel transport system permease protein
VLNSFFLRAVRMLATFIVVATAVFAMMRFSGDPVSVLAGPDATPDQIAEVAARWGYDRPVFEQFTTYMTGILRGDFGFSVRTYTPAAQVFLERVPATLLLGLTSLLMAIVIGMPLGMLAAVNQHTAYDRFVMALSVFGFAMPNFFMGILLILLFSLHLNLLPSFGSGTWQHLMMPAATLALSSAGAIARFSRSCMLDVLNQPYVAAARARGIANLRRTVIHALPNASIPIVTILGLRFGDLIAGAIIVETVFAWPGVGRLLATSVALRDLAVVQVIVLSTALTMILANLAVDLLYGVLDPRVRRSAQ